ncbi:hypothetical protein WR25_10657 isoform C [Diploscapter pachys]|nr:hypothetical protein WR25_10657 isoform C [Diploscapter pachys]
MNLTYGYSILQRLYTPYFGAVVFCGSWYPQKQNFNNTAIPPLQYPFNYIHITPKEMHKGYNGEICMIKAYELRLRNIKGHFAVADDAILNFWQPIKLDMVFHQRGTKLANIGKGPWWNSALGEEAMKNTISMLKDKDNGKTYQKLIEEYQRRLLQRKMISESETVFTELQRMKNWTISDVYYIPKREMPFYVDLMKIFYKNEIFIEISLQKYLRTVKHQIAINAYKLGPIPENTRRIGLNKYYNESMVFMHAIKLSGVIEKMDQRYMYCNTVIKAYHKVLFLHGNFTSGIENYSLG